MKNIIITLAAILISLIALPEKAEAGHGHHRSGSTYCSGYSSCGCPIYKRRVIVGYRGHHRPIYRCYSVPMVHRCRSHYRPTYRRSCSPSYSSRYRRSSHYPSYSNSHRSYNTHVSYSNRYGRVSICR